jgi:hypothetical protein
MDGSVDRRVRRVRDGHISCDSSVRCGYSECPVSRGHFGRHRRIHFGVVLFLNPTQRSSFLGVAGGTQDTRNAKQIGRTRSALVRNFCSGSGHVARQSFGERRQWGGSYGPRFGVLSRTAPDFVVCPLPLIYRRKRSNRFRPIASVLRPPRPLRQCWCLLGSGH